ncbi:MAG: beta-N-acetylhexosaminidase [Zoogloeaceae bacterium]|jgi:beta-N-acetylhexosaminidase|nr:beta-N-acetylhexosaminidase [Zoogloeaceae bacterium]
MMIGPFIVDLEGESLNEAERFRLNHPEVGGLILFSRNYQSVAQLAALIREVRACRSSSLPPLLIAVDHEGGRVQRFREGFTRLPPMRRLGERWEEDADAALREARQIGYLLAAELRAVGVDFSFTPVLDLDYGVSGVIGDRAFHGNPDGVIALAGSLIEGLRQGGMASCGKHFPGHGAVVADSHLETPVDTRELVELAGDLKPFRTLPLAAVMPAHVIYPKVDARTACFSEVWHRYLRRELGFEGAVFSDDLSMQGAGMAGDMLARAHAAYAAGCDMLLICNAPEEAEKVLRDWRIAPDQARSERIRRLLPSEAAPDWETLHTLPDYREAVEVAERLCLEVK